MPLKALFLLAVSTASLTATKATQAATGTITLKYQASNGSVAILTKTNNISGPAFLHGGANGNLTATFTDLTNASGSISADMVSGGYESFCDSTFITVVTNKICRVTVAGNAGDNRETCRAVLNSYNPATCDFSVTYLDIPYSGGK